MRSVLPAVKYKIGGQTERTNKISLNEKRQKFEEEAGAKRKERGNRGKKTGLLTITKKPPHKIQTLSRIFDFCAFSYVYIILFT
jgi:hypothetical protein